MGQRHVASGFSGQADGVRFSCQRLQSGDEPGAVVFRYGDGAAGNLGSRCGGWGSPSMVLGFPQDEGVYWRLWEQTRIKLETFQVGQ